MDNISFTGGFLIKNPGDIKWKQISKEILPETRYIKGNFLGRRNMFFAANKRFDREIATYLLTKNYVFTYYPNVDLKSGICNMPKDMAETMVRASKAITERKEIIKAAAENESKSIPADYVRKPNDHIAQTMSALRTIEHIPADNLKSQTAKGITIFVDENGRLVAKASPNNARGFNFIKVYDRYSSEDMEMLKVDYTGQIYYRTTDIGKLRDFERDFLAALMTSRA